MYSLHSYLLLGKKGMRWSDWKARAIEHWPILYQHVYNILILSISSWQLCWMGAEKTNLGLAWDQMLSFQLIQLITVNQLSANKQPCFLRTEACSVFFFEPVWKVSRLFYLLRLFFKEGGTVCFPCRRSLCCGSCSMVYSFQYYAGGFC